MLDIRKNYFQFLNLHALRAKMTTAMIPDPKLMVGTAEDLTPQPVLVYKDMTDAHYSILTKQLENLESQRVEYGISQGHAKAKEETEKEARDRPWWARYV